jgi:16S rRNA (guanine527-N7)-methyltransferase
MNELDKSIELLKRSSLFKKESGGDEQADMIAQYLDLLFRWNEKINLTGISDMDEAINTLVLNSMCGLEFVPINGTLLDIGSGSGIPGIVLRLCAHLRLKGYLFSTYHLKLYINPEICPEILLIS